VSATLVARRVTAAHGARTLYADLDLVVAPGDVIGLVGANGAGKSTLLRQLAGLAAPDTGTVTVNPPGAAVGFLAQEPERVAGETLLGFLARRAGVADAAQQMDAAAEALASPTPDSSPAPGARESGPRETGGHEMGAADAYSLALERWLDLGGADFDDRVGAVAADVGLGVALDAPMTALSGGEAARAALGALLLSRYDVYLLDEPTNDLDLDGLARLERFVTEQRSGIVVVSHDREFLARTATAILELDLAQQRSTLFGGGYDAYLAEREVQRRHARQAYDDYADRRDALGERARTQRNWMENGVRNARRKSSDNDKIGRKFRAESTEKQAAKARQTERLIERLDEVAEPRKEWALRMSIAAAPRSGAIVAVLDDAVVRRPGPSGAGFVFGPVSAQVDWADRVVITGANGAGKTTLLAALLGRQPLDEGRAWLGPGVVVGEVDQARGLFTDGTLVASFERLTPELVTADIRTLLAKFGLRGDHVDRPASSLSPGERTRAALALLQARGVNLLVLDEPTNHLDLAAIEQLESALDSFAGTVLLVSHDRRLVHNVRTTRRWTMADGRLTS
jgi:ATPase subunit of ABC transporter with duplicated ATPase domains